MAEVARDDRSSYEGGVEGIKYYEELGTEAKVRMSPVGVCDREVTLYNAVVNEIRHEPPRIRIVP